MNIKKRVDNNIPFSLHDSRIIKISVEAERLTLTLDKVYEYNGDSEKSYPATMLFEGIDYEEEAVAIIARRAEGGMRDAFVHFGPGLSLTAGAQLTTAMAEEITGSISQEALDLYACSLVSTRCNSCLGPVEPDL